MTPVPQTDPAGARVLLVQWSGDYREAYQRLSAGGAETYHAQRESVETAGEFAKAYGLYGVLCMTASTAYDEVMPNGVRAIGVALDPRHVDMATLIRAVEAVGPTHLVVTTPQPDLFGWALGRGVHLLPALADTFHAGAAGMSWPRRLVRIWRHVRYCRRLAKLLNDPRVRWVGNHNVSASRDLVRIVVDPHKVIPCDFPPQVRPEQHESKSLDPAKGVWELLYVGSVVPSKGVGDAVLAAA